MTGDVMVNRTQTGFGWFFNRCLLFKGGYGIQN
jgi:hypothetical protein